MEIRDQGFTVQIKTRKVRFTLDLVGGGRTVWFGGAHGAQARGSMETTMETSRLPNTGKQQIKKASLSKNIKNSSQSYSTIKLLAIPFDRNNQDSPPRTQP